MLLSKKRNIFKVVLLITLLNITLGGTLFIRKANANPMDAFFSDRVYSNDFLTRVLVTSPSHEAVYLSNTIPFSVKVVASKNWQITAVKLVIYLDNLPVKIIFAQRNQYERGSFFVDRNYIHTNSSIRVKEEGLHSLIVYAIVEYSGSHVGSGRSGVIPFTVNNTKPQLEIISIDKRNSYATSDVPLDFIVSAPASKLVYCLDGQANTTISGNTTLAELPDGEHEIIVYVWDENGNVGASAPVVFNISVPESEVFPTTPTIAIAVLALVAALSFVLLTHFVRHKRKSSTK